MSKVRTQTSSWLKFVETVDQFTDTSLDYDADWHCDDGADPKGVFVNHVDTYMGKNISLYLSQKRMGSMKEAQDAADVEDEPDEEPQEEVVNVANNYRVSGTMKNDDDRRPAHIKHIVYNRGNPLVLARDLCRYAVIIYDISQDESQIRELESVLPLLKGMIYNTKMKRTLILLSTVMTWAKTKPVDPEDTELLFTEEDYKRRKAHDDYAAHLATEKLVTQSGKEFRKFRTYVVCCGLVFGLEQDVLEPWWRQAWRNESMMNYYGPGSNVIPMVHILDVAQIVQGIIEIRPKTNYFLGAEGSGSTQKSIVRAINKSIGSGRVTKADVSVGMDSGLWTKRQMDLITLNLNLEPALASSVLNVRWTSEDGFVAMASRLAREFKQSRGIKMVKVCILGPPGAGKTLLTQYICDRYMTHHLTPETIQWEEKIEADAALEELAAYETREIPEGAVLEVDRDDEEDLQVKAALARKLLDTLETNMVENNGSVSPELLVTLFRTRIASNSCQNQGYVLDGFPYTKEMAKALFSTGFALEEEEEQEEDEGQEFDRRMMPDFVFVVEAADDVLIRLMKSLPESEGTRNEEPLFSQRLEDYRELNQRTNVVADYFDEVEVFPNILRLDPALKDLSMGLAEEMFAIIGKATGYGESVEDRRIEVAMEEGNRKEELAAMQARLFQEDMMRLHKRRHDHEPNLEALAKLDKESEEIQQTNALPLRNYLMKHVMPALSEGISRCIDLRPEDPLDFLAEYLMAQKADPPGPNRFKDVSEHMKKR